jgi:hypothetical protein
VRKKSTSKSKRIRNTRNSKAGGAEGEYREEAAAGEV